MTDPGIRLGTPALNVQLFLTDTFARRGKLWAYHVETVIGQSPSGDCYPVVVESGPLPV